MVSNEAVHTGLCLDIFAASQERSPVGNKRIFLCGDSIYPMALQVNTSEPRMKQPARRISVESQHDI